jgi:hypothetical protein
MARSDRKEKIVNYGRPSPEEALRRVRSYGVFLLGFGVHGVLLMNAVKDPSNVLLWIFYGTYTMLFVIGARVSSLRDKRSNEAEVEANSDLGRDRAWF